LEIRDVGAGAVGLPVAQGASLEMSRVELTQLQNEIAALKRALAATHAETEVCGGDASAADAD
jgi:hypothetical protein